MNARVTATAPGEAKPVEIKAAEAPKAAAAPAATEAPAKKTAARKA